jgi:hypothetical protein
MAKRSDLKKMTAYLSGDFIPDANRIYEELMLLNKEKLPHWK